MFYTIIDFVLPPSRSSGRSMLHKVSRVEFHPLGVVGAIVSWNYPFHNIFNPMLAAVFAGNGIVIKVHNKYVHSYHDSVNCYCFSFSGSFNIDHNVARAIIWL